MNTQGFTERRWRVREGDGLLWKQIKEGFFISPDNGTSWSDARPEITLHSFADVSRYEETFDHLPSLPEKEATQPCPMDVCLCPKNNDQQELEKVNEFARTLGYGQGELDDNLTSCIVKSFDDLRHRFIRLENFYKEVQRILSDVDGSTRVQAELSNALRKVEQV